MIEKAKPNQIWIKIIMAGVLLIVFLLPLCLGEVETLGTFKQNECINLRQTCSNCTYNNISSVLSPAANVLVTEKIMSKLGTNFNYTFCNSSLLGKYIVNGYGDIEGVKTVWAYDFNVNTTGEELGTNQSLLLIGQLGLVGLFLVLGIVFSKEKWKIKTFFFIMALLMGVVTLNSVRIIASSSSTLSEMGNMGLIIGIIILSFMILYLLLHMTIEVFNYFKNKKERRWNQY